MNIYQWIMCGLAFVGTIVIIIWIGVALWLVLLSLTGNLSDHDTYFDE